MTRRTEPLFDERIADWLEDDPVHAPREVLDIVMGAIPSIPRRRPGPVRWSFPTMRTFTRVAATSVLVVVAIGGAFYLTRPSQPAIGPSVSPSASAAPSPTAVRARAPSWTPTGPLVALGSGTATRLLDGRVLVAGNGPDGKSAELYDPRTGSWVATGVMVSNGSTATLLQDGRVLVVGGHNAAGGSVTSAQLYDPAGGTWSATASMTTARQGFSATLLPAGTVLVAGGERAVKDANQVELASAELYDPGSGNWTATGSMLATRFDHSATLLSDGKVLVAGGSGLTMGATICCDPLPTAELYDPVSGTWTSTGSMTAARVRPTATRLVDGRVLVAGGGSATAELYDPNSGLWAASEAMPTTGVIDFTATLMADGKVLVAGGWDLHVDANGSAIRVASAELYDPNAGTWTVTVSMAAPRMNHVATLLLDGRVLVAGGDLLVSIASQSSAELYDPGTVTP